MRFVNSADHQIVDDFARAQLKLLEGLTRKVTLSHDGCAAISRIRTELLAFVGEAQLVREKGGSL